MDINLIIRKNKKGLWYITQLEKVPWHMYLFSICEISEFSGYINYIMKHFNAKMNKNLYFETKEDAEKAKEWIESTIIMHTLVAKN